MRVAVIKLDARLLASMRISTKLVMVPSPSAIGGKWPAKPLAHVTRNWKLRVTRMSARWHSQSPCRLDNLCTNAPCSNSFGFGAFFLALWLYRGQIDGYERNTHYSAQPVSARQTGLFMDYVWQVKDYFKQNWNGVRTYQVLRSTPLPVIQSNSDFLLWKSTRAIVVSSEWRRIWNVRFHLVSLLNPYHFYSWIKQVASS